jgi:4a-hydroxytetrahydrobiopterin dehydratase
VASSVIARRQPADPGWRRVGQSLVRELSFRNFDQAFAFVQHVAHEAVDYLRRPDICIFDFNRVRLTIANPHRAELTEAELRLARKVDAIMGAAPAAQRAAIDGRAWTRPPTRSVRPSRTTSARRVVQPAAMRQTDRPASGSAARR